ncbi:SMI1/KNR4 family protein [Actinoplanes sp. GCM10030250]|uniref:SMI1/KNR4 family protein n=1 Tax=Actinoplanes sp. GCM10030250 TaxID=3273376 RepID=UPI00360FC6AE
MNVNWAAEIDRMMAAKQLLQRADPDELWRHEPPNPPASDEAIRRAESDLGRELDEEYAAFLRHADGWPAILQNTDLFSTAELSGGPSFTEAKELLADLEPHAAGGDVFPIGASETSIDLFVMLPAEGQSSAILWLAGVEVERYGSFPEFFGAMVSHNMKEAGDMRR